MLRLISTFFISLLIYVYSYSQNNNDIIIQDSSGYIIDDFLKIKLENNEKLKRKGVKSYTLFSLNFSANQYLLNVRIRRETRCGAFGHGNRKIFREKYLFYVLKDSANLVHDFLLVFIKTYYNLLLKHGKYLSLFDNDTSKMKLKLIPDLKGAIIDSVPNYIIFCYKELGSNYQYFFSMPEFLLYYKGKIYCFETIKKGNGEGNLSELIVQKVYIKKGNDYKSFYPSKLGITIYEFQQFYKDLMCQDN